MAIKSALELIAEREGKTALELATDGFQSYYNASIQLSLNKEYEIQNGQSSKRRLTRADAAEVKRMMDYYENEISKIQGVSLTAPKINQLFTVGIPLL